ncbi:hypothetical protein KUCAC02_033071 [Chaenocephalus aceratus]|nr:hypothetical protein KUCAC02_033071 [Chaenocephalus aceratus]
MRAALSTEMKMVYFLTKNETIFQGVLRGIPEGALRETSELRETARYPEALIWKLNKAIGDASTWQLMIETLLRVYPGFEAGHLEDLYFWRELGPALGNDLRLLLRELTYLELGRVKVFLQMNLFEGYPRASYCAMESLGSSMLALVVISQHGRETALVMAAIFKQIERTDIILRMYIFLSTSPRPQRSLYRFRE